MITIKFSNGYLNDRQQRIVSAGFEKHADLNQTPKFEKIPLNWSATEDNRGLLAVLTADVLWDWLYIDELWVDESYRNTGVGKKMMMLAEDYAASQHLTGIWLWTQSWQAEEFYVKLGYSEFTRFPDFPKGHQRVGFRKIISIVSR